jgi:hypothetical protein
MSLVVGDFVKSMGILSTPRAPTVQLSVSGLTQRT